MIHLRVPLVMLVVCLTTLFSSARAAEQSKVESRCSLASFKGHFGFSLSGTNLTLNMPFAMVGRLSADGAGGFSGKATQSSGGRIIPGMTLKGTYKLAADCTGNAVIRLEGVPTQSSLDFVLVDNGKQLLFINLGEGTVEWGSATLISSR